jgi:hypothetical protein
MDNNSTCEVSELSPNDERWGALVQATPEQDPYYFPGYALAYEAAGSGRARGILVKSGTTKLLFIFLKRSLLLNEAVEVKDVYSPYGYGGLLIHGQPSPATISEAIRAIRSWASRSGLTLCLVRLHPLLRQAKLFEQPGLGTVLKERGPTVALNLREWNTPSDLPVGLSDGRCSDWAAAAKRLRLTWATPATMEKDVQLFRNIYNQTMARLQVDPFFQFPPSYYDTLMTGLGSRCQIGIAWVGDTPVGAAIFLFGKTFAHYHLSGTLPAGRTHKAATYLILAGARLAREKGCNWLHLGGGLHEGDGLFKFKASFGGELFQYATLSTVIEQNIYNALVSDPASPWPYKGETPFNAGF